MGKWTTMAVCALVASFTTAAWAEEANEDDFVDLEEAIEYAELVNVFLDGDGAKIAVYLDDVQGLMWEQPISVSTEEWILGDAGILGRIYYMVPYSLYIKDDYNNSHTYYRSQGDITYGGNCMGGSQYCTEWYAWGSGDWENVEQVYSKGYSYDNDWSDDYMGQYWELDEDPEVYSEADYDIPFQQGGSWYYPANEWSDPDGGEEWFYGYDQTNVTRHKYWDHIAEHYRYVEIHYTYLI